MTEYPIFEKLRKLATPHYLQGRLHTETEIKAAEKRLNVHFPDDYRTFLLKYFDAALPYYSLAPIYESSHSTSIFEYMEWLHRTNGTDNLIPFVQDCGEYYCFEINQQIAANIRHFTYDYSSKQTWTSFSEWVEKQWIQDWLDAIDEDYHRRNRVEKFDAEQLFFNPYGDWQ